MASVRYKPDPAKPFKFTPEELARLDAMTDEEITSAAEGDPDNPPLTEEEAVRGLFARELRRARENADRLEGSEAGPGSPCRLTSCALC
jgi:putative transcriptional regulator